LNNIVTSWPSSAMVGPWETQQECGEIFSHWSSDAYLGLGCCSREFLGLKRGPQALGYETSLWTSWRVAHLIEEECGVRYHASQAWRILGQLGWSCQRPVGRALERDEEKIRLWKQKRWPEIKKKPAKRGAPSSSSTRAD